MTMPHDPQSQRAAALLGMTERLAQIIAEVGSQLAEHALASPALLEEQVNLANAYRHEMQRVHADPELLRGAAPGLIDNLIAAGARLRAALDRHQHSVEVLKAISEGMAEAMAQEVSRQLTPNATYGAQGGTVHQGRGAPAVAIDRRA